jgi:hypothetical protein
MAEIRSRNSVALAVYVAESISSSNVVGGDVNLLGGKVNGLRVECAPQEPAGAKEGMVYFNTSDRNFYGFDGECWKRLSS